MPNFSLLHHCTKLVHLLLTVREAIVVHDSMHAMTNATAADKSCDCANVGSLVAHSAGLTDLARRIRMFVLSPDFTAHAR